MVTCLCSGGGGAGTSGGQLTLASGHRPLIVKFQRPQLSLHPGTWALAWLSLCREKKENVFISGSTCNKLEGVQLETQKNRSCLAKRVQKIGCISAVSRESGAILFLCYMFRDGHTIKKVVHLLIICRDVCSVEVAFLDDQELSKVPESQDLTVALTH